MRLAITLIAFACCLAGCGRARTGQGIARAQERSPQPTKEHAANARGITVHWSEKFEHSIRRVLDLEALSGRIDSATDSGELSTATGTLYKENKPRTRFTAPRVRAYKDKGVVLADGGVIVTSIDPPGITVKAARIRWDSNNNKIYAEGGARFFYKPPDATKPYGFGSADHMSFNTELQNLTIP